MPFNFGGAASGAAAGAQIGSVIPGVGTAIGAVVGGIAGAFTGKQKAPDPVQYQPVDVQEEQRKAIAGNLANFNAASLLASKTNTFSQGEASRLLEQAMPGFGKLQSRLLQQVNDDLNAQTSLPQDVSDKIAQYAAEKGITRGTSGQFNGFSLVKDFGFNLVDYQNAQRARALNTLSTVYGMAPRVNVMSPMASMVDPNTAIQVAGQNSQMQYNVAQGQANASAAAANYNRSQTAGLLQTIGTLGGLAYDYTQAKVNNTPQPQAPAQTAPPAGPQLSLRGGYTPLAGATVFKYPGQS